MQLSHTSDDRLAGVFVRVDAESRIFFSEALKRDSHFFLIELRLRLDGHGDNRIGKRWRLKEERVILIAKRVAGRNVLDADDGSNVTRIDGVDIFAFVGLDLDQTADSIPLIRARIVDCVALGYFTAVNAEEDEFADEGVRPKLEGE